MSNPFTERQSPDHNRRGTPGVFTSEFWLTIVGVASILVLALTGNLEGEFAGSAIAGATGLYGVSRGLAKRN